MKKLFLVAILLLVFLVPATSMARTNVFLSFGVGIPAPIFVAPVVVAPSFVTFPTSTVIVEPAPVIVHSAPVFVYPPPVVIYSAPVFLPSAPVIIYEGHGHEGYRYHEGHGHEGDNED